MSDMRAALGEKNVAPHGGERTGWTQLAASLGFALVQIDVTVVNVALPRLGTDLGAGIAGLQWIVDGYALVLAVMLLIGGFLGDRFGARRVYLIGLGIFAFGSALCGAAPEVVTLVAARAVQGIGAAVMLPCSLSLVNHATQHDPPLRLKAVGLWTACGSVGLAVGPLIGGLLLAIGSWRLIFLINLPVCLAAALFTLRAPETPREEEGQGFDPLGQVLAILALGGLTGAVIEAHPLGFGHPIVIGLFVLALVATPLFILVEARSAGPLMPLSLFRSGTFSTAVLLNSIAAYCLALKKSGLFKCVSRLALLVSTLSTGIWMAKVLLARSSLSIANEPVT